MFNFLKKNKGQNTAEYALLIALVVAGIIAMQQYAQRALQARVRDASTYMASSSNVIGSTIQYEPYYQKSDYLVNRDSSEKILQGAGLVAKRSDSDRTRTGNQETSYNAGAALGTGAMPQGL